MAQKPYEERAHAEGVARPFRILRRMGRELRSELARILGWRFPLGDPDPDRESWEILNRSLRGLQSRTHYLTELLSPFARNNNWWEILCRTARWLRIRFDPGIRDVEVEQLIFERSAEIAVSRLKEREILLYDRLAEEVGGLQLAASGLGLTRNATRFVVAGLVRTAPAEAKEGGYAQLFSWLNDCLHREGLLFSMSRGVHFLQRRLESLLPAWWELSMRQHPKGPDPNLRRISVTILAIHLMDRIERSLEEFEGLSF